MIIIQMHRAAELLKGYDQTIGVELGGTGSREKRVSAARAVANVAQKLVDELGLASNPKAGACLISAVSNAITVPSSFSLLTNTLYSIGGPAQRWYS